MSDRKRGEERKKHFRRHKRKRDERGITGGKQKQISGKREEVKRMNGERVKEGGRKKEEVRIGYD